MATPLTGRYCAIAFSTGTSGQMANMGHWELNFTFDEIDASDFATVWKKNVAGKIGWRGSMDGFFDPSTSGHQIVTALNNALDATKVQDIRFYLSSATSLFFWPVYTTAATTNYSTDAGAYLTNVRITADKNDLIRFACDVIGYGPIALFQTSSLLLVEGT